MKKQTKSKTKLPKRSVKSSVSEQHDLPDLVAVMLKVAERLDGLEKKIDQVIQTSFRSAEPGLVPNNVQQPQGSGQNHNHENPGRQGRVMHQTVCANCRKTCEVPFRPTGERPVYCKECFAKRKDGRGNSSNINHTGQAHSQLEQVRVIQAKSKRNHPNFAKHRERDKPRKAYQRA